MVDLQCEIRAWERCYLCHHLVNRLGEQGLRHVIVETHLEDIVTTFEFRNLRCVNSVRIDCQLISFQGLEIVALAPDHSVSGATCPEQRKSANARL